jgi:Holliday junction resolvase RusA-like endonuclease
VTETPPLSIVLPLPPSANRIWRKMRGHMVKSSEYRAWKDAAAQSIAHQLDGDGPMLHFAAFIILPRCRIDPDNRIKPILDACQAGGAIEDDKHLRRLVLTVDDARDPDTALIQLSRAEAPAPKPKAKRTRK